MSVAVHHFPSLARRLHHLNLVLVVEKLHDDGAGGGRSEPVDPVICGPAL